jgi:alkaline phosphatase
VFLVSSPKRSDYSGIAAGILASGADVILVGGERHLLPKGKSGRFGPGERNDGRDLIAEAAAAGYQVVQDRESLAAASRDPSVLKLLGVFAEDATYAAQSEESLAQTGTPLYSPEAPTAAEMTDAALRVLERTGRRFALVVEEEGTDDFANNGNASGVLAAFARADAAIGVAREFLARSPDTLLLTAADSDASGLQIVGCGPQKSSAEEPPLVPRSTSVGAPLDGVAGIGTQAFLSGPDSAGSRFWFGITFASGADVVGGVVVRAAGINRERLPLNLDNTRLYDLMWETLFGKELPVLPQER